MIQNKDIVKPFLKWAGGKGQILPEIRKKYPFENGHRINRYCEPFVGGGAVFFDVLSIYNFKEVLINDINKELVNCYMQIQNNIHLLIQELAKIQDIYIPMNYETRKSFYYEKRDRFNYLKLNDKEKVSIEKAVLFIFLNRTCFNGLFRVNSKGLFNVPMGKYKNPLICDKSNLRKISKLMTDVTIRCGDYKSCIDFINSGAKETFVYIDPPYRPLTKSSNFTSYDENVFGDREQLELGSFVIQIHKQGAKIVLSNSDPKNVDSSDNFFDELYGAYHIERISAKRIINSNSNGRGPINELLITNFEVK